MEKLFRGDRENTVIQYISRGKTLPGISFVYHDTNRSVVDFSEATIDFVWALWYEDTDQSLNQNAQGAVGKDANGNLSYAFSVADTNVKGIYFGYFDVTYSDGSKEKIPQKEQCVVVI